MLPFDPLGCRNLRQPLLDTTWQTFRGPVDRLNTSVAGVNTRTRSGTLPTTGSGHAGLVHNHVEWRKAFLGALISL